MDEPAVLAVGDHGEECHTVQSDSIVPLMME
jgi:hypothetical protein